MKQFFLSLFVVFALVSYAPLGTAIAQPESADAVSTQTVIVPQVSIGDWTQLIPVALAFVLPLLLGAVKKFIIIEKKQPDGVIVYELPKWFPKWLPLVLVPIVVFAADMLTQLFTGSPGLSPYLLAVLPTITSWLYNVAEQIKKASTGGAGRVVKVEGLPDGVTGV